MIGRFDIFDRYYHNPASGSLPVGLSAVMIASNAVKYRCRKLSYIHAPGYAIFVHDQGSSLDDELANLN